MDSIVPYVTLDEAQAYFDDARLNAESWDDSTSDLQLKATKQATRAIDRLSFKGCRALSTQPNEFPRNISGPCSIINTVVPDDIKIACCELALTLLDGVDPDLEEEDLGSQSDGYATIRITSDPNVRKDHIKAGIPSVTAWKHLLPYLNDPLAIHIRRG